MPTLPDPTMTHDLDSPDYPHGTERGYFRVRHACEPCLRAKGREDALRRLRAEREGSVETLLVAAHHHLLRLLDVGGHRDVMRAADLDVRSFNRIVTGVALSARRSTLLRVLQTSPDAVRDNLLRGDMHLSVQRVRSMAALGWPLDWQTRQVGVDLNSLYRQDWITRAVEQRIAALAEKVGDQRGPSAITAARARSKGWRVPGAYDSKGNLIPGAALVDDLPARRARLDVAERRAEVHRLTAEGLRVAEIAALLGVAVHTVQADKGRPVSGLARRLQASA